MTTLPTTVSGAAQEVADESAPVREPTRCKVVALGASAGGLEAFERFFRACDAPLGFAYVVVQHLAPEHESILPQLLASFTRMPVEPVSDGTEPLADHVYVIPANATLLYRDGRLRLTALEPRASRQPISAFFTALAYELGRDAIAIVLSGTGSDGAAGIHDVHLRGGLTLAQAPSEARYEAMPRSAIATGDVDLVVPAADMPALIGRELERRRTRQPAPEPADPADPLDAITTCLRSRTGHDFGLFKRTTLHRRLQRRLTALGLTSLSEYLARLRVDDAEAGLLARDLMIGVTRFFRDREAFEALRHLVVPSLFQYAGERPIRVWVPGCASGEEAYSIAMLLLDHARASGAGASGPSRVQVFATDIDERSLAIARLGLYPASVASDVPAEWLGRYLTLEGNRYGVSKEIRDCCIFSAHDVLRDPPFSRLDLVSCRNLLIYFGAETQARLLPLFHYALRSGGFLFLGSSETVGDWSQLFEVVEKKRRIFRRTDSVRRLEPVRVPLVVTDRRFGASSRRRDEAEGAISDLLQAALGRLLEDRGAAIAIVDGRGNASYFGGPVSRWLPTPPGAPTTNVVELASGDLRLELSGALLAATSGGGDVRRLLPPGTSEAPAGVEILVRPLLAARAPRDQYLVLLREPDAAPEPTTPAVAGEAGDPTRRLEGELRLATERWRRTVQELESANEQSRSANEELHSMNEELQSSNEELQLSQEELQSINEELNTVNAELAHKIDEVNALYADLQNLFQSTNVATVFVDRELRIERFTPPAAKLYPLTDRDVGRPLPDLAAPFAEPLVEEDARAVLEDLVPRERIAALADGSGWYLVRARPYLSPSRTVDGVVLTFVDVSQLKATERRLREAEARFRGSVETLLDAFAVFRIVRGPGGVLDYGIEDLNAPARAILDLQAAGPGRALRALLPQGSPLLAILDEAATALSGGAPLAVERHGVRGGGGLASASGGDRVYDLRACALAGGLVVVAWRDVSDRALAAEALRDADRRKDEFLAVLGHELRNPLAAIQNGAQLAMRGTGKEGSSRHFELVLRQVRLLSRLVDDLLDTTRITQGKIRLERVPVDLVEVARSEVDVQRQAAKHGLRIRLDAPRAPAWVSGDRDRIAQMVGNLLGNACKFTDPGGGIDVAVRCDPGGRVRLTVVDDGIGMGPETLAHLFEPFRQADHSLDRAQGGLGLGLSLVRSLAALMGAEVSAASGGIGKGSRFEITFLPAEPEVEPPPAPAPPGPARPLRILVVEDNRDVADTLVEYLSTLEHETVVASDGVSGVEKALAWRPHLVLCDIGLPGLDGFEVARELRRAPGTKGAVLVALTGYGREEDRARALEAGFDHHATKPFDLELLDRFIAQAAERELQPTT